MTKWYVEYKYKKNGRVAIDYMNNVEAEDGKQAIEYVKAHSLNAHGAYKFYVEREED